jgi:two-component system, OmpR family, response regulator
MGSMKLLYIEDNRSLVESLRGYLGKSFVIEVAYTAAKGTKLARANKYDIILLDLKLPDGNGLDICRTIREFGVESPILVLTAEKDTVTKIQLLEAGADDFLTKPFHVLELRARLQALLRRPAIQINVPILSCRGLTVNLESRQVERDGKSIELRPTEFSILEYLLRNQDRAVTRQMIFDHVWQPSAYNISNTVDVHIKYLRDKIDKPFDEPIIETVYGIGYIIKHG